MWGCDVLRRVALCFIANTMSRCWRPFGNYMLGTFLLWRVCCDLLFGASGGGRGNPWHEPDGASLVQSQRFQSSISIPRKQVASTAPSQKQARVPRSRLGNRVAATFGAGGGEPSGPEDLGAEFVCESVFKQSCSKVAKLSQNPERIYPKQCR